jgi:hypothetical protein
MSDHDGNGAALRSLLMAGRITEAHQVVRRKIVLTPNVTAGYSNQLRLKAYAGEKLPEVYYDRLRVVANVNSKALELLAEYWKSRDENLSRRFFSMAAIANPKRATAYLELARVALEGGDTRNSETLARQAVICAGDFQDSYQLLAQARLPGPDYLKLLEFLDQFLKPRIYLEIGVKSGASLAVSSASTLRLGIDPHPVIEWELGDRTAVEVMTSKMFFDTRATTIFERYGPPDLVFIDGLHSFAATLADFVNVERNAHFGTVICLHDTLPVDETSALPLESRRTKFWTGDSWRIVPCLRALRPDLRLLNLRAGPSGFCIVAGIDPKNRTLEANYQELLQRFGMLRTPIHRAEQDNILGAAVLDWGVIRNFLTE